MTDGPKSIGDLMGRLEKKKTRTTERGELLKFFSEKLKRPIKVVGVLFSQISKEDLYAIKSMFEDRERRNGLESAVKWLWWARKNQE